MVGMPFKLSIYSAACSVRYTPEVCTVGSPCLLTPTVTGVAPKNWAIISPAANMSINSNTGDVLITSFVFLPMTSFIITFDGYGLSMTYLTLAVSLSNPVALIAFNSFISMTVGVPVSVSAFTLMHLTSDATFTISPSLPFGVTFSLNTISGTPEAASIAGPAPDEYTVSSSLGGSSKFRLIVNPAPTSVFKRIHLIHLITLVVFFCWDWNSFVHYPVPIQLKFDVDPSAITLRANESFVLAPTIVGTPPTTWSVYPPLPTGLVLQDNGTISGQWIGSLVTLAQQVYTVQFDGIGQNSTQFLLVPDIRPIVHYLPLLCVVNAPCSVTPILLHGTLRTPLLSDALPSGLNINALTGVISGTPTTVASGVYKVHGLAFVQITMSVLPIYHTHSLTHTPL